MAETAFYDGKTAFITGAGTASVAYVQGQQVLKREGIPQDIVAAMLYLTAPDSSFVTGETLKVSGGFTLGLG